MSGLQLASATASLRDSLARLAGRLEVPTLAVRATRARIRANEVLKTLAVHMAAGTTPAVPEALVNRTFTAGGLVSMADPAAHGSVTAALLASEKALAEAEALLG